MILGAAGEPPTPAEERHYLEPNYDFSKFTDNSPLGQWDWKGIWAFRGKGYMARQIDVPVDMATRSTILGLAENDSYNEIYINGKLVKSGVLKGLRKIDLAPNTWNTGLNQIVVKFENMTQPPWYGLGLRGSVDDLYLADVDEKISIADNWKLIPAFAEKHEYVHSSNNIGATIYNSMIAPLIPFPLKGVLWYQGESNANRAYQYRKTFPLLIEDWRRQWRDTFPFYFVQLSSFGSDQNSNEGSRWAELREAQTMTLQLPKTGMAVHRYWRPQRYPPHQQTRRRQTPCRPRLKPRLPTARRFAFRAPVRVRKF